MRTQWLTPQAAVRATNGRGDGAFAVLPIARGEIVAVFGGYVVTRSELDALPVERRARSIQVDADLFLVSGEAREPGDMVNHGCDPNCGMRGDVVVVARRDIGVGEELSYDYAMSDAGDHDEFVCHCGAPGCRGMIRGTDWRDPELQARYAGYFTTFVGARIGAMNRGA
jgi:hypothetical protein